MSTKLFTYVEYVFDHIELNPNPYKRKSLIFEFSGFALGRLALSSTHF